jgi:TRAP-type C4-dicarboxylate transport system permease large subunit
MVANIIIKFDLSRYAFLFVINILFLFLGMVIDAIPAMLIFFPVLLPAASTLGIDPIHFGVIIVLNLMIGLNTPPVGALLFVESKISGVPFVKLAKATLPYTIAFLILLLLTTYVPAIVTFLPNLLMP